MIEDRTSRHLALRAEPLLADLNLAGVLDVADVHVATRLAGLVEETDLTVRLAGMTLSAGTLVAFAVSRTPAGLFNFREVGFHPSPQAALAVLTEGSALLLLLITFVMERTSLPSRRVHR